MARVAAGDCRARVRPPHAVKLFTQVTGSSNISRGCAAVHSKTTVAWEGKREKPWHALHLQRFFFFFLFHCLLHPLWTADAKQQSAPLLGDAVRNPANKRSPPPWRPPRRRWWCCSRSPSQQTPEETWCFGGPVGCWSLGADRSGGGEGSWKMRGWKMRSALRQVGDVFFPHQRLLLRSDPQARRAASSAVACVSISGCSTLRSPAVVARWWASTGKAASCFLQGLAVFFPVLCSRCRSNMIAVDDKLAWWACY